MKALLAVLFFLPVWHRQKEQRLIEKVPVKLTVRPFPQKDLMDSLLTSRLMEQRFALIDHEEMLQRAEKAGQFFGGAITNIFKPGCHQAGNYREIYAEFLCDASFRTRFNGEC